MGDRPGSGTPPSPSTEGRPEVTGTDARSIARVAAELQAGGIVAIPTETVYGLAADARSPAAVRKVFLAKGRPADHPLIVHVAEAGDLSEWARGVPDEAFLLAEAFWPGPLTLVLPRNPSVPPEVTGGRDSVAVRMPSHPVASEVIRTFGRGIAAPSANRFGRVSPTTAADVIDELGSAVDLIVDGGPCQIGVESTVVELGSGSGTPGVTILRPGGVTARDLEEVLGRSVSTVPTGPARAPGMLASHYAPRTPILLCDEGEVPGRVEERVAAGERVGLIALEGTSGSGADVTWDAGGDLDLLARSLYGWLRQADAESLDLLIAVPPRPEGIGAAVRDRLERAAHPAS